MTLDVGGYIFQDEVATEAWARTFNDPNLICFIINFVTIIILAGSKYQTVSEGHQQYAAAVNAQFSSLDIATIQLSYSLKYPECMLVKSDKEEVQLTESIWWAHQFASHTVFEGSYMNDTHPCLKRERSREFKMSLLLALIIISLPSPTQKPMLYLNLI
jgi:hypothetical protein